MSPCKHYSCNCWLSHNLRILGINWLPEVVKRRRPQDDSSSAEEAGGQKEEQEETVQNHRDELPVLDHLNKGEDQAFVLQPLAVAAATTDKVKLECNFHLVWDALIDTLVFYREVKVSFRLPKA